MGRGEDKKGEDSRYGVNVLKLSTPSTPTSQQNFYRGLETALKNNGKWWLVPIIA
jgi:dTDP-D-glucose 4,6-dehydratase